ncbi:hypothetical protein BJX61DRAFT_229676 [Aspergillus egyptiacus]|nr:hypothetical protein BJX61DRAFT_229676 [Aspergillus egyptiacus]
MMADSVQMGDPSGCQPTFSLFPHLIPTVIRQRLTSRYTIIRTDTSLSPSPMSFDTVDKPSPSGSGYVSASLQGDTSNGGNKDALTIGMPANCEGGSGLHWNRVNPALNLLRHACYEAQQPRCESRLVRALYLNAVSYLVSALPEDLTSEEAATLRTSLPEKVKSTRSPAGSADPYPRRSHIHRLLASTIVYFCLLLQFVMPFIKGAFLHLYKYERSRRLTERMTGLTLYIAERVSQGSVNFGSTVLNTCDGKPRKAASSAASWWIEGIAGGICEGVGEGMVILGFAVPDTYLERPPDNRRKEA